MFFVMSVRVCVFVCEYVCVCVNTKKCNMPAVTTRHMKRQTAIIITNVTARKKLIRLFSSTSDTAFHINCINSRYNISIFFLACVWYL